LTQRPRWYSADDLLALVAYIRSAPEQWRGLREVLAEFAYGEHRTHQLLRIVADSLVLPPIERTQRRRYTVKPDIDAIIASGKGRPVTESRKSKALDTTQQVWASTYRHDYDTDGMGRIRLRGT